MPNNTQFTRLPEAMELADIGPYLKSLREHYRLSISDVAARLHMRGKYIEAIEQSNFDALPSKVYARGYVANYAEFLGIDPKQVIEKCFGRQATKSAKPLAPKTAHRAPHPPIKLWLTVAASIVVAIIAYEQFITPSDSDETQTSRAQNTIDAVPAELLKHTRQLLLPLANYKACLLDQKPLYCLSLHATITPKPYRSIVEKAFIPSHDIAG
jgi:cytoskeletal protein RodZ